MGFLSVIRRWALRDKMPIREIARRTGLSRNTIKKYLREGAVEPQFKTPKRSSKLDPYADRLSAWLLIQTRKSRKERRTVKQMHADLVKLGYDAIVALRLVVTPAANTLGTAIPLDNIPCCLIQWAGEILLPYWLTRGLGVRSRKSEKQDHERVTPVHLIYLL